MAARLEGVRFAPWGGLLALKPWNFLAEIFVS